MILSRFILYPSFLSYVSLNSFERQSVYFISNFGHAVQWSEIQGWMNKLVKYIFWVIKLYTKGILTKNRLIFCVCLLHIMPTYQFSILLLFFCFSFLCFISNSVSFFFLLTFYSLFLYLKKYLFFPLASHRSLYSSTVYLACLLLTHNQLLGGEANMPALFASWIHRLRTDIEVCKFATSITELKYYWHILGK